ncbi:MAG: MoaD family protein [Coriobacteriia bacterium]|nr:MoaD family protein [Coriobacteriia bacterium]
MNVKFFATYRKIVGQGCIDIPAPGTVLDLLAEMERRYPAFRGQLLSADGTDKSPEAIVLVCGRHIEHLDGVRTVLTEQDYVALTPLVAGG